MWPASKEKTWIRGGGAPAGKASAPGTEPGGGLRFLKTAIGTRNRARSMALPPHAMRPDARRPRNLRPRGRRRAINVAAQSRDQLQRTRERGRAGAREVRRAVDEPIARGGDAER